MEKPTFKEVLCLYFYRLSICNTLRNDYEVKECAVYVILGYDLHGKKEILGIWLSESESLETTGCRYLMRLRRVVDVIFFISMDGVSGLEDGAKAIFPSVVVQRCIVHLIRNSVKYVPTKDYKKFTQSLKKVYGAINLKCCSKCF